MITCATLRTAPVSAPRADAPRRKRTSTSCACTAAGAGTRTRLPSTASKLSRASAKPRPPGSRSRSSWSAVRQYTVVCVLLTRVLDGPADARHGRRRCRAADPCARGHARALAEPDLHGCAAHFLQHRGACSPATPTQSPVRALTRTSAERSRPARMATSSSRSAFARSTTSSRSTSQPRRHDLCGAGGAGPLRCARLAAVQPSRTRWRLALPCVPCAPSITLSLCFLCRPPGLLLWSTFPRSVLVHMHVIFSFCQQGQILRGSRSAVEQTSVRGITYHLRYSACIRSVTLRSIRICICRYLALRPHASCANLRARSARRSAVLVTERVHTTRSSRSP
jgi:hypothetical protein